MVLQILHSRIMKQKRSPLLLTILLSTGLNLAGQSNLISNGSFESSDITPICWGQAHRATDWQSQFLYEDNGDNDSYNHSPDYYDENVNLYAQSICTGDFGNGLGFVKYAAGANSGNRFIGIGPYELIEQLLDQGLTPGQHYTLSMYVALTNEAPSAWVGDYELTLGVARNEVKYRSQDGFMTCPSQYGEYLDGLGQELFIVGRIPLTLTAYPPSGGWQRVSVGFRAPEGPGSWDWLFIDVTNTNDDWSNSNCSGDYVFIDDVSLSQSEFCNSVCSPELGPINHSTLPNAMIANGNNPAEGLVPFLTLIENAIGLDFVVYSDWEAGTVMWEEHSFDPMGIKDPGYSDYVLTWYGEDENGNMFPQSGNYEYNLKLWNCDLSNNLLYERMSLTYLVGSGNFVQPDPIISYTIEDCCEEYKFHQNVVFTGLSRTDVHSFITAGSNVTAGPTGPVVVSSLSSVYFHAGSAINLEPGFSVDPGGQFTAIISDCVYGAPKNEVLRRDRSFRESASPEISEGILVWPTYLEGESYMLKIGKAQLEDSQQFSVSMYDAVGRLLSRIELMSSSVTRNYAIPRPSAAYGYVLIVVRDMNESVIGTERIVVQ